MASNETLQGTLFSWVYTVFGVSGDVELINRMTPVAIIYTIVVGIVSIVQPIAYGKHSDGKAFTLSARAAWIIQEIPAFIVPVILVIQTPCLNLIESNANKLAIFCFMAHYFHRSLIYPFRVINPKPVAIINCIMAFVFCSFNGLYQGLYLTNVSTIETSTWTYLGGLILFSIGMATNIQCDGILIGLRKNSAAKANEKIEYKIPRGGLFELVSGANYFGEIVEWWGLFVITNGMPQLTFAAFSTVFLGLRAVHHHRWYKKTFGRTYPDKRKAIVPFVF